MALTNTSSLPTEVRMFLGSLYQQQAQILRGELPFNTEQTRVVSRALDNYKEIVENAASNLPSSRQPAPSQAPAPATGQQPGAAPTRTRNLTQRIGEALSSNPAGLTMRQLYTRIPGTQESTIDRIVTQQVTAGTFVKEANKYRTSTTAPAAAPAAAPGAAAPAAASRTQQPARARTRARGGSAETATDRVANLVLQRPGITKADVITAMSPARPNHVGIWLARLCSSNRITGTQAGKDGPYYPTATAQRQAAAA